MTSLENEAARVRGVRDRFFHAIATLDTGRLRYNVTTDYTLIEDGLVWNLDSLLESLDAMRRGGHTIEYAFEDLTLHAEPPTAWMTYRNRGVVSGPEGADTLIWIESAVFRRERGRWRMALLHSTRLRPRRTP